LAAEITGMSVKERGDLGEEALAEVLASSGVKVGPEEIGAVARSLARIERAAILLRAPPFDETNEQFYRLLEDDGTRADA